MQNKDLIQALREKELNELITFLDEEGYEYWFTETSVYVWGNGVYLCYHFDAVEPQQAITYYDSLLELAGSLLSVDRRAEIMFTAEDHNSSQIKQDLLDLAKKVKDYCYEKNGKSFCKIDDEACIPGESNCLACKTKLEWIAKNLSDIPSLVADLKSSGLIEGKQGGEKK